MKFKSVTGVHDFSGDALTKDFRSFMELPLFDWALALLRRVNVIDDPDGMYLRYYRLDPGFRNTLNLIFRRSFSDRWSELETVVLSDPNLTADFFGLCLQNYARQGEAENLESVLAASGSGWRVVKVDDSVGEYGEGGYDLQDRVPPVVALQAQEALAGNNVLLNAWGSCYSRSPDYTKTVIECQNVLEGLLRDKYEPKNTKPQLGKLIGNLKAAPTKISFKGDSVLTGKELLLSLIENVPAFRGMHTAGTGKAPTKQEAEYVLHTTIYIWNLHEK